MSNAQKSYKVHAKALPDSFKSPDDFQAFQTSFWKHLEKCGLDTIGYVPNLVTKQMMSVVLDHSCFTVATIKTQMALYDTYNKENDRVATECLIATLSVKYNRSCSGL